MDFNPETWKEIANEKLRQIGRWLDPRKAKDAPYLVYGTLCGLSLWPLIEAARAGEFVPVVMALGGVAGGVGGNLIAEQVGRWKDQADPVDEPQVTRWVVEHAGDAELRAALDVILEKLDAIPQAQTGLGETERRWFVETLKSELSRLGNLPRFEATLIGSGAIAQGAGAVAATTGGVAAGRDIHLHLAAREDESKEETARRRYLECLRRYCKALPLAALGGEEGADEDLTLDSVYIALDTTTPVPLTAKEQRERQRRPDRPILGRDPEASRPLTVLEAAAQSRRLVLLGDPGAGKSTFVRKLLAWLAEVHLGEATPPSDISGDLLPVLIVLRDLTPRLTDLPLEGQPADRQRDLLVAAVRDHVLDNLGRLDAAAFVEGMDKVLLSGRCLLALDGLDEVPHDLRRRVRQATAAVIGRYELQRVIVTCRVRSYRGEAVLPGFQAHTLAPFDENKVRQFTRAWYNAQKDLGRVDVEQAKHKAENLTEAALSGDLREMSANPMMLTTMAIIHQKEIGLPKERVRLYDLVVDVLLRRWQKRKMGERALATSPVLAEFLKDDVRLRRIIELLAYETHRVGQEGTRQDEGDLADLSRGAALTLLEKRKYLGDAGLAAEFLDYVDQRAGLLVGRGGELGHPAAYGFPHRVFQEYLTGCYMVGQRDATREFYSRAGKEDYWSLAAQLGAEELFYNRRSTGTNTLLDLAYGLCPASELLGSRDRRALLWSGNMAALLGRETVENDAGSPGGGSIYLQRLIPRLVDLLGSDLPATERAEAGRALARLGDPRFRPDAWRLPDEPLLGFVEIPAGSFLMGSSDADRMAYNNEKPQREATLPAYYAARYPVTQAQYWAFVQATGHKPPAAYFDSERPYEWRDGQPPPHLLNHPVVLVTWHNARAYCAWLTGELRGWKKLPGPLAQCLREQNWRVRLPTEAEWEKAARGQDGRLFPWGGAEPDPNRANYADTNIGGTSAVGCFPGGASPYGCQDMAGNVREWCATKWQDSYKNYRDDNDPEETGSRVLRGGAFYGYEWFVRCAFRHDNVPHYRLDDVGFRVVVAPG